MIPYINKIMLTSIENLSHINGSNTNTIKSSSNSNNSNAAPNNGDHNALALVVANGSKVAKAVLICHPNSHSFHDRTLLLEKPIKIGRSVGHNKTAITNGFFDCKVLSRNHALLWFEDGKFLLRDTRSSNGTFVNTERLSKSSEESPPREVFSGDTIQFGVDVVENSKNVTHGCVIATLKLFLPNGREAKPALPPSLPIGDRNKVTLEDMYLLNQFLQESLQRERMLESKLNALQTLMKTLRDSTELSWKALISNNSLLSRVELLEVQLKCYSKKFAEDKLREELCMLQEDKNAYEGVVKQYFQKIMDEKIEAAQQCQDLNRALADTKTEFANTQLMLTTYQTELRELAAKNSRLEKTNEDAEMRLQMTEEKNKEVVQRLTEQNSLLTNQVKNLSKTEEALQQTIKELETHGDYAHKQVMSLQSQVEDLQKHHSDILCELVDPSVIKDKINDVELVKSWIAIYAEALRKCSEKTVIVHKQVDELRKHKASKQQEVTMLEGALNRCASDLLNFKEEQAEIEAKLCEQRSNGVVELYKPVPVILDELNEKKCAAESNGGLDIEERKKLLNVVQRDIKLTDSNFKEVERLLKSAKDELVELTVSCAIEEDKLDLAEKQLANLDTAVRTLNEHVATLDTYQKENITIEDVQCLKKQLSEAHDIAQEKQSVAEKLVSHLGQFTDAVNAKLAAIESCLEEEAWLMGGDGEERNDYDSNNFVNELTALRAEMSGLSNTIDELDSVLESLPRRPEDRKAEENVDMIDHVATVKLVPSAESGQRNLEVVANEMVVLKERFRSVVEEKKQLEHEYAMLKQQYDCIESYPYFHLYISVPIILLLFCIFNFGDKLSIVFGTKG